LIATPGSIRRGPRAHAPLVVDARDGRVYFSPDKVETPAEAVAAAEAAIEDGTYRDWHSHEVKR
jgi:hypothetical protein